jgi:dipeptidyl aminopeptidase/acylaminoacyl peptidase
MAKLSRIVKISLLTILTPATWAASGMPIPSSGYTPLELMGVRSLTDSAISPDGNQILYVVTDARLSENRYVTNIWSVSAKGGTPRQLTHEGADSPRWAPDGSRVAFLVPGKEGSQLWEMRPDGTGPRPLIQEPSDLSQFEWSADGKRIAFLKADSVPQSPHTTAVIVDQDVTAVNLHAINLDDGKEQQITHEKYVISEFSWSPNGREIVFSWRPSARTLDDYNTDISLVRLGDGQIRPIVKRPGRDDNPRFSPDGRSIAFTSTNGSSQEYSNVDIFVVPVDGGPPRNVTPHMGERLYGFYGWSTDGRDVYFRARRGVTLQLFRSSVATGAVEMMTNGNFVFDAFSFSQTQPTRMAFLRTDSSSPKKLFESSTATFRSRELVDPNPQTKSLRIGPTSMVHWKAKDGSTIEGLLAMPAAGTQAGRAPILVILHGGPSGAFTVGFTPQVSAIAVAIGLEACPAQLFTERGYAVFMPNIRGSGGYGESFRKQIIDDWGGEDFNDVIAGLDALATNPLIDIRRAAVLGWSYGGFMTAWAIANTDRFSAAVVGAGPTDLWSWYGTTDQPDQAEAYFGGTPWEQPQRYLGRSTIRIADRIHTPTLILHGERDEAVPINQAQQLYRALRRNEVPVQFVMYPRSGHDPTEPQQNLDVWQRTLDWLNRWLPPTS